MPANPKTRAYVDANQKDPKKAVDRVADAEDRQLPASESGDSVEQRALNWADKDRAVRKRLAGFQRSMTRQFEQQRAEIEADRQRERREHKQQIEALRLGRESAPSANQATHDAAMAQLEKDYAAALDSGESVKAAGIQRKMVQVEAEFQNARLAAVMGTPARREAAEEEEPAAQRSAAPKPTSQGLRFTRAQDWWDDPEFAGERGYANGLHAKMVHEDGSDPESEEHYAKLAAALKKKFPDLDVQGLKVGKGAEDDDEELEEEEPPPRRETRRAQVPDFPNRGDERAVRRQRGTQLTESDFETMRKVGMDPSNDKHLVQFALSKQETAEAMRASR